MACCTSHTTVSVHQTALLEALKLLKSRKRRCFDAACTKAEVSATSRISLSSKSDSVTADTLHAWWPLARTEVVRADQENSATD